MPMKELPIILGADFDELQITEVERGFVRVGGGSLGLSTLSVAVSDAFDKNTFKPLTKVRLVDPVIAESNVVASRGANSGILSAKIVLADAPDQTRWNEAEHNKVFVELKTNNRIFEAPDDMYFGKSLAITGVRTDASASVANARTRGANNNQDISGIMDDVTKVTVYDSEKHETYTFTIDGVAAADELMSEFALGDLIDFDRVTVRFFEPEPGQFNHFYTVEGIKPAATNGDGSRNSNGGSGKPEKAKADQQQNNDKK